MAAKKQDIGDQLLKLVDVYTSTTSAEDIRAAEKKSKAEQKAAEAKTAELKQYRSLILGGAGLVAGVSLLVALRTLAHARRLA